MRGACQAIVSCTNKSYPSPPRLTLPNYYRRRHVTAHYVVAQHPTQSKACLPAACLPIGCAVAGV
jgi:hypothetical protein